MAGGRAWRHPARIGLRRFLALAMLVAHGVCPAATLDALWRGQAHFRQVGELDWKIGGVASKEQAGSFLVHGGTWYALNRMPLARSVGYCPADHAGTVIRSSTDRGKTWSAPVSLVEPGDSRKGDGCAVLDGTAFFDAARDAWHLLAQCLDRQGVGGWMMCHYTRAGTSPLGRFTSDPANPVVRGGRLWSGICAGSGKACPASVVDEGTPDIVGKRDGLFVVTMHGFDPVSKHGFRGVVETSDFRHWRTSGAGLPGDATLAPRDCASWMQDCAGFGQATTLVRGRYRYMVVETVTKSLACAPGQGWVFQLLRAPLGAWPRSGEGGWQRFGGAALLSPTHPVSPIGCPVQYARWLADGDDIYLVYEDWEPNHDVVHRRLLKLVAGGRPHGPDRG